MRKTIHLTDHQIAMIIGTVLGDGCLIPTITNKNMRLQIEHCESQREYVLWKFKLLESLVLTSPKFRSKTKSWRFRTISHPEITSIGDMFYNGRHKIVPKQINELLYNPISLAVWFMDDGSKNRNDGLILNTQCFTREETERLRECLIQNFGLTNVSLQEDKSGWRLYIQKRSSEKMTKIIDPFVLPCLTYKMISPVETTRWPLALRG